MIYAYIYETRVYNRLFLTMNAAGYFGTSLTSLSLRSLSTLNISDCELWGDHHKIVGIGT